MVETPVRDNTVTSEEIVIRANKRSFRKRWIYTVGGLLAVGLVLTITTYIHYSNVVTDKLRAGPFASTSVIYATPATVNGKPQLLGNIALGDREKRQIVAFNNLPKVLIDAVVSVEDKRFFDHLGFDPLRLAKAAYVDAKERKKEQGASTITMQLARSFWLDPEKRWRRKISELFISMVLEHRLSKQEIFELYANEVYLGQQDTFSIHGFGEAAHVYFNKEVSALTLPEAALLAGMIQRPSHLNPYRNPDRARERRNIVVGLMQHNGFISPSDYIQACAAPLGVSRVKSDTSENQYFLALANDELQNRLPEGDAQAGSYQVYTTLDLRMQRAALEAIRVAMPKVDALARKKKAGKRGDGVLPQVALIAMDPHTGEVKAAVGGRNYGESQLNHLLSKRQPGSVFKPFVYAAALNTGIEGGPVRLTEYSVVTDQPTTFSFGNQVYQPSNFGHQFYGRVTLRQAIAKSMNVATVTVAQQVGYGRIVALAKRAGLNEDIRATPSVALGAYEVTPLEMAGAYTVFANSGTYVRPTFLREVRRKDGITSLSGTPERQPALDPRTAWLMRDMLEAVVQNGTAGGVWSYGLKGPMAGKTGTSHDGWFAGFTPDLLCIVWVGYDDNRELDIEGAKSALPVWAEFMKRAAAFIPAGHRFDPAPPGIVSARIDTDTGLLAGAYCPNNRVGFFISGTEPSAECAEHITQPWQIYETGVADHVAPPRP